MNPYKARNFIGFWLLGLSNNFAYVVMLSAAHDILSPEKKEDNKSICNPISTSFILLLDIIPSLVVKLFVPFLLGHIQLKVLIAVGMTIVSFLLAGLDLSQNMAYLGVVFASLASGLGEITFLGYMSKFEANAISGWSSGTGAAGFFGSLSYFLLTYKGFLTSKQSILAMLVMPFVMLISFFFILKDEDESLSPLINENRPIAQQETKREMSLKTKFTLIRRLFKYMIPLALVYLFEYFINQGLSELIYFKDSSFTHSEQYRSYQTEYQLGVLISRSSLSLVQINNIWLLAILQGFNMMLFLAHILHPFLTAFWIASIVVLFEGLIGGAGYVNTFYKLKKTDEFDEDQKEFCLSITSLADTLGITISAFSAIPIHNVLCDYMKTH